VNAFGGSTKVGATLVAAAGLAVVLAGSVDAGAQPPAAGHAQAPGKPGLPPADAVTAGLDEVVSFVGEETPLYTLYKNEKDGTLLAALPKGYEKQLLMIAPTITGGDQESGVMGLTFYARWERIGDRLALLAPNFFFRNEVDAESGSSVEQLYTQRVITDVPIVAETADGRPVVDMKLLLIGQGSTFFPSSGVPYGPVLQGMRPHLASLTYAKAFPENLEIEYRVPDARGQLMGLHYSISVIPENKSYKPREADSRAGYFNLLFNEPGQPNSEAPWKRYIARWQVEKADPQSKLSPPKEPIVWYIESTTPIRYRRFVREGILAWNKAFEEIGIVNALEVYQQDATTGAHMEKDPEDARYNFFRWNISNQGYAIGPSRWDPRTGQILDADVVWHSGLTSNVRSIYESLGSQAVQSFPPETLAWLDEHPEWDPRVRLAFGPERQRLVSEARARAAGLTTEPSTDVSRDFEFAASTGPEGAMNAVAFNNCRIGDQMALNFALMDAAFAGGIIKSQTDDMLDGVPEEFLGAMIKYIAAHEVGHCLGLQHAWSTSTIHSLAELNSGEFDGPIVGSVMEYAAPNINADDGPEQGPYATPVVGPYDEWVIAFGYGPDDQLDDVLARVSEPELVWHPEALIVGPDPRVQTWDIGADSLEFGKSRMKIVEDLRPKATSDLVEDGESWAKARQRWNTMLGVQMQAVTMASRWVGASYVNRDHKGDPGARNPIENVPAAKQREALQFVIDNSFYDESFDVTPDVLHKLSLEYFPDGPGYANFGVDPSYNIHDTIGAVQAIAMTSLLNPTTLRRVYDNEYRTSGSEDTLTLAEVIDTITDATWVELDDPNAAKSISSFRRNLQKEYVDRMVFFSSSNSGSSPTARTIETLSTQTLRELDKSISDAVKQNGKSMDAYTRAHLTDIQDRIARALDYQAVDLR
jgi:hypothetical protein